LYVHSVPYQSGAIGCISRNYPDGKWRIVCDPRPSEDQPTFETREQAAKAEWDLTQAETPRLPGKRQKNQKSSDTDSAATER
jgi:hypothetical protein